MSLFQASRWKMVQRLEFAFVRRMHDRITDCFYFLIFHINFLFSTTQYFNASADALIYVVCDIQIEFDQFWWFVRLILVNSFNGSYFSESFHQTIINHFERVKIFIYSVEYECVILANHALNQSEWLFMIKMMIKHEAEVNIYTH